MATKKRIHLILAALLSLGGVLSAGATDYQAADYLPLAVGNSWTYSHHVEGIPSHYKSDSRWDDSLWSAYNSQEAPRFTITVLNTEVIAGKTYYVLSDMPANWPPAPPLFIAGKKLRWEGTHLMQRTSDGEQAIFRFDGTNETGYEITTNEGNIRVAVRENFFSSVPRYDFDSPSLEGGSTFLAGYGIELCGRLIYSTDVVEFRNEVYVIGAVLGGRQVKPSDARRGRIPTASSSSSWAQIKQSLFSHTLEGRNSQ